MKRTRSGAIVLAIACGLAASAAHAQRGVGDPTGVARQAVKPEGVSLSGKVLEVMTGPCENTTGRSPLGTHFLMKTEEGETLNIHLGPAVQVEFVAKDLSEGKNVQVRAFRTDKMEESHYVAQSLAYGDRTVQLRDDDTLRPVWAGGRGARNRAAGVRAGFGLGRGWGAGYGYRHGRGPGGGYGQQRGRGPGWGRPLGGQPWWQ